jgi:hypothetical protein
LVICFSLQVFRLSGFFPLFQKQFDHGQFHGRRPDGQRQHDVLRAGGLGGVGIGLRVGLRAKLDFRGVV